MGNLFEKYFKSPEDKENQNQSELEIKESITVGRLEDLSREIKKINIGIDSIFPNNSHHNVTALFNEFIQAENKLDSNSKIKLYRKIRREILNPKAESLLDSLNEEFRHIESTVQKIDKDMIQDTEKKQIEIFLDYSPIWQKLDKIQKFITILEKVGLDVKDLKNKIIDIEAIIEKEEFKTKEGDLGRYDE